MPADHSQRSCLDSWCDFFDEHIKPELRIIRRGSKVILIPVVDLERWVDHTASRWAS